MYSLLVVDDDPIFEFIAEKTFSRSNSFDMPTFFQNGKDALDFLELHKADATKLPDLILLDLYMPELNGWDFMKRFEEIKQSFIKAIPVYILSSSVDPRDIKMSASFSSIQSFVSKPLTNKHVEELSDFCEEWYHGNRSYAN